MKLKKEDTSPVLPRGLRDGDEEHRSFVLSRRKESRRVTVLVGLFSIVVLLALFDVPHLVFGCSRNRESARRAHCANNLRQIAVGCAMYAQENDGHLPSRLEQLYPEYVDQPKIFSCPSSPSNYQDFEKGTVTKKSSSYVLVPEFKETMPGSTILAYDKSAENHSGAGRNVAFVDAHVEWMRESAFQAALKKHRAELAKLKSKAERAEEK